jgi:ferredoxin
VVGVDFTPDALHFCPSMNADWVESGFDLFLSDIGDHYLVMVGTSRGDDIVELSGCLLEETTAADVAEYKHRSAERRASYATEVEIGDLPGILEMEYGSKVWEELGDRCLSCGACTAVCPTCYCFDVYDEDDLAAPTGTRGRTWDSCLFASHARVAGGENFPRPPLRPGQVPLLPQAARVRGRVRPPQLRGLRPLLGGVPGRHRHRPGHPRHPRRGRACSRWKLTPICPCRPASCASSA